MTTPDGLAVRFRHERRLRHWQWGGAGTFLGTYWDARRGGLDPRDILPHGGVTTCRFVKDGMVVAEGTAVCSDRDNYCKAYGRALSYQRALLDYLNRHPSARPVDGHVLCDGWFWPGYDAEGDPEPVATDLRLTLDDDVIDVHVASTNVPLASVPVEAVARLLAEAVGR